MPYNIEQFVFNELQCELILEEFCKKCVPALMIERLGPLHRWLLLDVFSKPIMTTEEMKSAHTWLLQQNSGRSLLSTLAGAARIALREDAASCFAMTSAFTYIVLSSSNPGAIEFLYRYNCLSRLAAPIEIVELSSRQLAGNYRRLATLDEGL